MADLTITAANVKPLTGATLQTVTYGETIDQGESVYLSANKYYKADADASEAAAAAVAIAITPGVADGVGVIATRGSINVGATLTQGEIYVVSGNAGGIAPEGDLASGDYVTIIGIARSSSELYINIIASGAQVP